MADHDPRTPSGANPAFGVYVHIPFCEHRCDYCAFATWTDKDGLTDRYLAAMITQIEREVASGMAPATSVFVGGGTPSRVPAGRLAEVIAAIPTVPGDVEVTVECNPDDVTADLLAAYAAAGVTRISLGAQSMVPSVLATLGRRHNPDNVARAAELVRESSIPSFNLDLIYGAAGETLDEWAATVDAALALDPDHISAYGLTVEPGTPLADDPGRHPDDDDQADKYELVDRRLVDAGMHNYEISNWSKPGHRARHNLLYWRQQNYAAIGCAAHGHADGVRWWNLRTPERYIAAVEAGESPVAASEQLDAATREFERLELMLRMSDGVPVETLDGASLDGLVSLSSTPTGDRWVLTRSGRLMANEISTRLRVDV